MTYTRPTATRLTVAVTWLQREWWDDDLIYSAQISTDGQNWTTIGDGYSGTPVSPGWEICSAQQNYPTTASIPNKLLIRLKVATE